MIFLTLTLNSQVPLYKGLISGMTENEVSVYFKSNSDFTSQSESFVKTVIKNRTYSMATMFNKSGKLKALFFLCNDRYEWVYYKPNIKENAEELFSILTVKYGEPTFNKFCDWTDIPKGKSKVICEFEKGTIGLSIDVSESTILDTDKYYITLFITDTKFSDKEIKSSEGF